MFESFIITLREGVEAALVLAIAVAVLRRRGLERLTPALFAGAGAALIASAGAAVLATRITWNEELAEGTAMLVGAVLVLTLVWWMWKAAPRMKEEIETGLARAAGEGGSTPGLFLFAFGMVFREGVETAVFLSAAGFNSQGLGRWLGAVAGVVLAIAFGVLFTRGSLRVPLKPFFSLTSAVLLLLAGQLLVGGLHELSEGQVLPSSRVEMAVVGPLVKNELLLFTLTVALAAGWLLFGPGRAAPEPATVAAEGPEARLARARRARERARRRWTGIVGLVVVGFLTTAFVRESRMPGKAPAEQVAFTSGRARIAAAALADHKLHFYAAALPGVAEPVRFFAVRVGDKVQTCFDACEICGAKGYFQDGGAVVCRNCTSPIALSSLGRPGGCNPIPLPHAEAGGELVITAADIERALSKLKGH
jgi:high-affinity iron transporter